MVKKPKKPKRHREIDKYFTEDNILALQRKKDKFFYARFNRWVEGIAEARLFEGKKELFFFLNENSYLGKGLLLAEYTESEKNRISTTNTGEINIVSVKQTVTVEEKILNEYKNKQMLRELEAGN